MRTKKLQLPKSKENKLSELQENVKIYSVILNHYDPEKIEKELAVIDSKIDKLLADRNNIVETRLKLAEQKTKEINNKLVRNKSEQLKIVTSYGLLAKLAKLTKAIKETEKLVGV